MTTKNGGERINTAQMLAQGTITGPHRRTKPVTLSWRQRLSRALRRALGLL